MHKGGGSITRYFSATAVVVAFLDCQLHHLFAPFGLSKLSGQLLGPVRVSASSVPGGWICPAAFKVGGHPTILTRSEICQRSRSCGGIREVILLGTLDALPGRWKASQRRRVTDDGHGQSVCLVCPVASRDHYLYLSALFRFLSGLRGAEHRVESAHFLKIALGVL